MPCLCCFSRGRTKSFPIHEKQRETEVQKIFIRRVESIRVTPCTKITQRAETVKTKPKGTVAAKKIETVKAPATNVNTQSRASLSKLFAKSKHAGTPSPPPSHWSISTYSGSKHASRVDSYDVSKEHSAPKTNVRERKKPAAKSKVVLENVRKMIEDQHVQQQRQKESARL